MRGKETLMETIKQLLDSKGHDIYTIDPDKTVYEAVEQMAQREVGALLVVRNKRPVGIVSERDYARKVILCGRSSKDTLVRDIMTTRLYYARPILTIEQGLALMSAKKVRHLPVIEDGEVLGMVTMGDLVKAVIAEQKFIISQLQSYITGVPG
jgi:CBS domain-containing protein